MKDTSYSAQRLWSPTPVVNQPSGVIPKYLCACLLALGMAVTMSPVTLAAGDPVAGEEKAHTCLGCHGVQHYVNTYPTYHVPKIAGQHQAYLEAALRAYRSKARSHPTMQANAGLLSDQDIQDISAWFSQLGVSAE